MASKIIDLCNIDDQKRIVAEALQKQLVRGDTWWLIANTWFQQWKSYVRYDSLTKYKVGVASAHPGPIDNTPIIEDEGKIWTAGYKRSLKKHLVENINYVLVPNEVWDYLIGWYGIIPNQNGFPRKVIEEMYTKTLKVEVYSWFLSLPEWLQESLTTRGESSRTNDIDSKDNAVASSTNLATGLLPVNIDAKPCENVTGSDALPGPSELCGRCEDSNLAPIHLCTTCDMLLCSGCHTEHQKYFSKMQHVVVVYSSSKPTSGGLSRRCPKHDRKVYEFFCNDHDVLICSLCFHQSHTRCQVDYIPELANSSNLKAMYDNAISDIDSALGDIKRKTDTAKSLTRVGDTRRKQLHELIDKRVRKLHSLLDKLRNEAIVDVNVRVDKRMKVVKNTIKANNRMEKRLKELKENVELFGNSTDTTDVFIATKEAMRGMKRLACDVEKVSQFQLKDAVSDITFEFDTAIDNVTSLGHIVNPDSE